MSTLRAIVHQEAGQVHGPITRLISPHRLGHQLKPFVFLDFFNAHIEPGFGFPMHPHSGIATLTWQPQSDVQYEDTTGQAGVLIAGGLEWMNAGGAAWHRARLMGQGQAAGFQLWVAMPPEVEEGAASGLYVPPEEVPVCQVPGGLVRVLLGQLRSADPAMAVASPITSHQDMNYLVLELQAGAAWHYEPPAGHDVAWAFVFEGQALVQGALQGEVEGNGGRRELLVMAEGAGAIELRAGQAPAKVLLGSARKHAHPLVLGSSSVHTSEGALSRSAARIQVLGQALAKEGRLG